MTVSRLRHAKRPTLRTVPPVSAEFRASCHAMVDRLLDKHPGSDAAFFAVSWDKGHAAVSEPTAKSVRTGFIDGLYADMHPVFGEE